jgi:hypothetical protein
MVDFSIISNQIIFNYYFWIDLSKFFKIMFLFAWFEKFFKEKKACQSLGFQTN